MARLRGTPGGTSPRSATRSRSRAACSLSAGSVLALSSRGVRGGAAILGVALLGERLTPVTACGSALLLGAVAL
ncbi:hypothetical protein AB0C32_33255, partial [Streptosporangium sp. NPDC048865]